VTMSGNVMRRLRRTEAQNQKLRRTDFDLTAGTAGQRTRIARYQTELPIALRQDAPMRLVFVAREDFTTDGTTGNTETFTLSNDLIQTPNTADLVLYEAGSRVQPDAVDYDADSFDYTDDGTNNTLHAYYVARDPVRVDVEKVSPKAQGSVSEVVYDDVTSVLHERDQNQEPPRFDFDTDEKPLAPVVPRKWYLDVYAEGPVAFDWDDDTDGTTAVNAVLSLPIRRAEAHVDGLSAAVKRDILGV
jgi:hypothetical protein